MPISHATGALSKPVGRTRVPVTTLEYLRTRNRLRMFDVVQKEFRASGVTQAELAARLGRGADRVCRLLGAPGNWTLDTVSDLLFAISGAEMAYQTSYPLNRPRRNQREPEWALNESSPDPAKRILEESGTQMGVDNPRISSPTPSENIMQVEGVAS